MNVLELEEIKKCLPHRYPMLLVDKIEDYKLDDMAIGVKNVTSNEHFFQGHFPNNPVMPGVLQIEAMAQSAGCVVMSADPDYANKKRSVLFMAVDGVKFRKPVRPGDQLRMHVEKIKERRNIFVFHSVGMVDDQIVSEADLTAMIVD